MLKQYHLASFGIIEVTGKEQNTFLNTQFSNNILDLSNNEACYATYNTLRGRVLANFIVCQLAECILLIVKKDLIKSVIQKLNLYKMRSQVTITDKSDDYYILGSIHDDAKPSVPYPLKFPFSRTQEALAIPCPNGSQIELIGAAEKLPKNVIEDENNWNLFEIQQGFAWISLATSEKCVAQMLNQEWLGAIHFKKGCYPGQEIIARAEYRGEVRRRPALLTGPSLQTDYILYQEDGQEVGIILNQAKVKNVYFYLAVLKTTTDSTDYYTDKAKTADSCLQLSRLFYYQKEG